MIQRIQSLYLLIVTILMGLMIALPLGHFVSGSEEVVLTAFRFMPKGGGEAIMNVYGLTIVIIAAVALPLITIFLFKKRMLQFRLCIVEMVLLIGVMVFELYYFWGAVRGFKTIEEAGYWTVGVVALLPIAAFIFTMLAKKGIKKDILLVKSLDRIR